MYHTVFHTRYSYIFLKFFKKIINIYIYIEFVFFSLIISYLVLKKNKITVKTGIDSTSVNLTSTHDPRKKYYGHTIQYVYRNHCQILINKTLNNRLLIIRPPYWSVYNIYKHRITPSETQFDVRTSINCTINDL